MSRNWTESETEVLTRVRNSRQILANLIGFMLEAAFPHPEHQFGQDILVAINVPRQRLGLSAGGRPGDIDLLVVPVSDEPLVERVIAIEAKIVRPTMENPSRNANAMGRSQALGLLYDGFPFVGLVHICIPSELSSELHLRIPRVSSKLGLNGELVETGEYMDVNPFPLISAKRQRGRVLALGLPPEIGFHALGLELSGDGQRFVANTIGDEQRPIRNPQSSPQLFKAIRQICLEAPELFLRVCWSTRS
jgi:hypothetical protein